MIRWEGGMEIRFDPHSYFFLSRSIPYPLFSLYFFWSSVTDYWDWVYEYIFKEFCLVPMVVHNIPVAC